MCVFSRPIKPQTVHDSTDFQEILLESVCLVYMMIPFVFATDGIKAERMAFH